MLSRFLVYLTEAFLLLTLFPVIAFSFLPVQYTPFMIYKNVAYFETTGEIIKPIQWQPYTEISKQLPMALIASEDQKFEQHLGFDWEAIRKVFKRNKKGKRLRGGSTISQQVAKNAFLTEHRNWFRKGLEAWFTGLIEMCWSKRRILEVYMNIVEFQPGIFGVKNASDVLKTTPQKLNKSLAARLAVVLPAPTKYKLVSPGPYVYRRADWVKGQMYYLAPSTKRLY